MANKVDLARSRAISTAEGISLAQSIDAKFIETSSGIQHNVDELLVGVLKQVNAKKFFIISLQTVDLLVLYYYFLTGNLMLLYYLLVFWPWICSFCGIFLSTNLGVCSFYVFVCNLSVFFLMFGHFSVNLISVPIKYQIFLHLAFLSCVHSHLSRFYHDMIWWVSPQNHGEISMDFVCFDLLLWLLFKFVSISLITYFTFFPVVKYVCVDSTKGDTGQEGSRSHHIKNAKLPDTHITEPGQRAPTKVLFKWYQQIEKLWKFACALNNLPFILSDKEFLCWCH